MEYEKFEVFIFSSFWKIKSLKKKKKKKKKMDKYGRLINRDVQKLVFRNQYNNVEG